MNYWVDVVREAQESRAVSLPSSPWQKGNLVRGWRKLFQSPALSDKTGWNCFLMNSLDWANNSGRIKVVEKANEKQNSKRAKLVNMKSNRFPLAGCRIASFEKDEVKMNDKFARARFSGRLGLAWSVLLLDMERLQQQIGTGKTRKCFSFHQIAILWFFLVPLLRRHSRPIWLILIYGNSIRIYGVVSLTVPASIWIFLCKRIKREREKMSVKKVSGNNKKALTRTFKKPGRRIYVFAAWANAA